MHKNGHITVFFKFNPSMHDESDVRAIRVRTDCWSKMAI